jgi:hypothetical protein
MDFVRRTKSKLLKYLQKFVIFQYFMDFIHRPKSKILKYLKNLLIF